VGSLIFATAEIIVAELPRLVFRRHLDPLTGYDELVMDQPED
jgi:predicted DNA-binding protein with PD1-like motif